MPDHDPQIDWRIAADDAEWEQLQGKRTQPPPTRPRLPRAGWVASCLLLVALVTVWAWPSAPEDAGPRPPLATPMATHPAAAPTTGPTVTVSAHDFWRDQEVARRLTQSAQGRLYQSTASGPAIGGPLRTALDAAFWGPSEQLETPRFHFRFRHRDRVAVAGAADQLERLYSAIEENLGLTQPLSRPKRLVVVSTEQHQHTVNGWPRHQAVTVRSPSFYPADAQHSQADRLAQAVALPLIDALLAQAVDHYQLAPEQTPLLHGLRLWQLWASALPLAGWRGEIVHWLLATGREPAMPLPNRYIDLCTAHQLWLEHPAQLQVPLLCTKLDQSQWQRGGPRVLSPPFALPRLVAPVFPDEEADAQGRTRTEPPADEAVAVALLIDYLVATYGRAALPRLLEQAGTHDSWATLIPASLTVPVTEVEAGWRVFLSAYDQQ